MRAGLRRGGRELVDDGIDRVRVSPVAVALLHVLPSLPFTYALLRVCVDTDQRGALPPGGTLLVAALCVPKIAGWGALAAWAAAAARGGSPTVGGAWLRMLARLPETLLCGAAALAMTAVAPLSLGLSALAAPGSFVALAAATAPAPVGGAAALRQGVDATFNDMGRAVGITILLGLGAAFLVGNLLVLPYALLPLGGGGLGLDMTTWIVAFSPLRLAGWGLAYCLVGLALEAVLVIAAAEWQRDREAEREGVRYSAFAVELEERAGSRRVAS